MAKDAPRLSDVQEREWSQSIGQTVIGVLIIVGSLIGIYFSNQLIKAGYGIGFVPLILGILGVIGGGVYIAFASQKALRAKQVATVGFACPYCDVETKFLEPPTTDFTCENCNRQVHFENGVMIPVRTIICQACRAEHRVAINLARYVCDRCNRPLRIVADPSQQVAAADASDAEDALLRNYDVLLVAYDHRRENDLAFKVQDLLVANMNEARRLMQTASSATPLIVAQNVPQRKAESIRRQLQEMGATATMRPTPVGSRPVSR